MNSLKQPPKAPLTDQIPVAPFPQLDAISSEIFNAAPDGILVSDVSGKIIFANRQAGIIFGYTEADLLQVSIEDLLPTTMRGHHQSLRIRYFEEPHTRPMGAGLDLIGQRKDGLSIPIEISLSTLMLDQKTCVISIVRDTTQTRNMARELHRYNLELQRSNEDLDRFAAIASHDLQEPLRMIGGYTQLLQRRYKDRLDSQAMEYMGFVMDGVKHLQGLIQDLLAFSRLTSQTRTFSPVDLSEVVAQVLCNLQVLISEKQGVITSESLPTVLADEVQMTQLFQNLVANSLKFCNGRPKIDISACREGGFWKIRVTDNGIGIPKEYREKVFGIFQRLHSREAYSGSGVGLAICKRIVERHHGNIGIEDPPPKDPRASGESASEAGGPEGTTIWFTLPTEA